MMIQAKELKEFIINLLSESETAVERYNVIDSESYPEIADKIIEKINLPSELIPLTPEWLERCGFKMQQKGSKHNYEVWSDSRIEIAKVDDGYALYVQDLDEYASWTIYKATQYLHQLQNLYFALTGAELNVTL